MFVLPLYKDMKTGIPTESLQDSGTGLKQIKSEIVNNNHTT